MCVVKRKTRKGNAATVTLCTADSFPPPQNPRQKASNNLKLNISKSLIPLYKKNDRYTYQGICIMII